MSDTHSETAAPRTRDEHGRPLRHPNDEGALNGGDISHMYRPDRAEQRRPARTVTRLVTAVALFGGLFLGAALLAGFA